MRNLLASILFTAACSSAYADRVATTSYPQPRIALSEAPARIRAPYGVEITRGNGETLPTYSANGRYYIEGTAGDRYAVRISNPTSRRIEAVVTIDGLDAIDGEAGALRKRGYIVPPYGDVRIEGFRTSLSDVATFRFSSVDGSYAGRKGKARNVGVIAVALFEERIAGHRIAVPPRYQVQPLPYGRGAGPSDGAAAKRSAPSTADAEAADKSSSRSRSESDEAGAVSSAPTYRPGLGTEFGESRNSGASYTQFVRASNRPVAIAELRYNDAAGLIALGIPLYPPYPDYSNDLRLRETADPFPGDHFARPPGR